MIIRAILGLLVCVLYTAATPTSDPPLSELTVYVVSSYGGGPMKGADVKLVNERGSFTGRWKSGVYEVSVPCGKYEVSVSATGAITFHRKVEISQRKEQLIADLKIGTIDIPNPDNLSGLISGLPTDDEVTWIRLIPLFGFDIKDTIVRKPGRYQFNYVAGGEYFLLILHGDKIADSHRIRVTDSNREFDFSVAK